MSRFERFMRPAWLTAPYQILRGLLEAEIYSYARSKGLFAGISLEGAGLAPNPQDIANYYGRGVTYKQLLFGGGPPKVPAEADAFRKTLP